MKFLQFNSWGKRLSEVLQQMLPLQRYERTNRDQPQIFNLSPIFMGKTLK